MSDIALVLKDNCYDLNVVDNDLEEDKGLETAVSISLFTDKRVTEEELPELETDQRGWWGDMFPQIDLDKIGSRLWTIDREKTTVETLRRSEELCKEALNWMLEDGLASAIKVQSEYNDTKQLNISVEISRPDRESERYSVLWDEQELRRL